MSITQGLEDTIRILRDRLDFSHKRINELIDTNEKMSDRIYVELQPQVERLIKELNAFDTANTKLRDEKNELYDTVTSLEVRITGLIAATGKRTRSIEHLCKLLEVV